MFEIDNLIKGAIDMHIHTAPDTMPMRVDVIEAARQAKNAGMKAIVIKSHFYPTTPLVTMARQLIPDINIFGSLCLDYEIGGLNSHALDISAQLGAKVVWMPTLSAANSRGRMKKGLGLDLKGDGYSILDKSGKLVTEIDEILKIVKQYNMVLATGHISTNEMMALSIEANRIGIKKIVITHASNADVSDSVPNIEEQKMLAKLGAFMEHTGNDIMPCDFGHNPMDIIKAIKEVGAEHCILSSDMGMAVGLCPVEGLRTFVSVLLRYGITAGEIEQMIKLNPSKLLDLN